MSDDHYFKIVSGTSDEIDSVEAAEAVISECKEKLNGKVPSAGLIFISIYLDSEIILKKVIENFPDIELIGCSHDGVFSGDDSYDLDAVNLTLFSSNVVDIKAGFASELSDKNKCDGSINEAISEARQLSNKEESLCILITPSIIVSGADILGKFRNKLGDSFPIIGGAAADDWKFENTFQYYKTSVFNDAATFLLFGGELKYGIGVKSGWTGKGEKGIITKSDGNIVTNINHLTAIEYFQQYLGKDITPLGEFPLVVYEDDDTVPYLRAALAQNDDNGSLIFAGDVPEGVKVQIGFTKRDDIIKASRESLEQALMNYDGEIPSGIICFSCSGRKQVLGMDTGEEYKLVLNKNPDISVGGFYGYGEIAPVEKGELSRFHNETFVTLILGI